MKSLIERKHRAWTTTANIISAFWQAWKVWAQTDYEAVGQGFEIKLNVDKHLLPKNKLHWWQKEQKPTAFHIWNNACQLGNDKTLCWKECGKVLSVQCSHLPSSYGSQPSFQKILHNNPASVYLCVACEGHLGCLSHLTEQPKATLAIFWAKHLQLVIIRNVLLVRISHKSHFKKGPITIENKSK